MWHDATPSRVCSEDGANRCRVRENDELVGQKLKSDAEIKAAVMAKVEAAIDQGLKAGGQAGKLTIDDIEDIVIQVRDELSEELTSLWVQPGSEPAVPGPLCSACGKEMHYKGQKRRYIRTRTGEVQLERAYYHCPSCGQGFFPPG